MISKDDIIALDEKNGLHLNLYQDNFYLQPVSIVGDKIYLKTMAPAWKKNGVDQLGKPMIVGFKIGNRARTVKVLQSLIAKISPNGEGRSIPQPGADNDDDFPG